MTTEISIMNKNAVAIAADSAVTTSDKVFPSANKIFALSLYHPVGIMVYANAEYCGIPWEIIIKQYRNSLDVKSFTTIKEYAEDFIEYLNNNTPILNNQNSQKNTIYKLSLEFADQIVDSIYSTINNKAYEDDKVLESDIVEAVNFNVDMAYKYVANAPELSIRKEISKVDFLNTFKPTILNAYKSYKLDKYDTIITDFGDRFCEMIYLLVTSKLFPSDYTGIVITGYGDKELFPSLVEYRIGIVILDKLQICFDRYEKITTDNSAIITPFAQADVIQMFMEGIHPERNELLHITIESILSEYSKLLKDTFRVSKKTDKATSVTVKSINDKIIIKLKDLLSRDSSKFIVPILDIISVMQPIELANIAESLVNITAIHRQVSHGMETVGGPIDVALISKGDGFIWIKRKHYFDPKFNPDFCRRRYGKT